MPPKIQKTLELLSLAILLAILAALRQSQPQSGLVEYQVGICIDLNADQKCSEQDAAAHGVSVDLFLTPADQQPKTTVVTNAGGLVLYTFASPYQGLDPVQPTLYPRSHQEWHALRLSCQRHHRYSD